MLFKKEEEVFLFLKATITRAITRQNRALCLSKTYDFLSYAGYCCQHNSLRNKAASKTRQEARKPGQTVWQPRRDHAWAASKLRRGCAETASKLRRSCVVVELTIAMRLQKRSRLYDLNLAIGVALNDQGSEAIAVEVFDLLHSRLRDCLWPRLRHDDPINILPLRSSAFPKFPCSHVPNFVFETNHPGQYFSEI